jgi:hypothetical protein
LATPVLKVELLGNAGAAEDVVATRHPQLLETGCLQQPLGVGKSDVGDGASQEACKEGFGFYGPTR